jgi:Flp pilus assembly protein CpaB
MTYRVRNIVIAVGLALVAMMLTLFYVTNYKRSVQHGEAQTQVWVAARDVPAGTLGADLVKQHAFKSTEVAKRSVVAGAISDPEQVAKLVLNQPLYAGEQVTVRRFQDSKAQGIVGQLKGTMRAVQISGDPDQLLGGTLKAGDRVDVVGNLKVSGLVSDRDIVATRIVLRDLKVLQVGGAVRTSPTTDSGSIILAVSDLQIQKLFFVLKNAEWTLELRPVVNPADSSERLESADIILSDGISAPQWRHFLEGNFRNIVRDIANGQ